MASRNWGYKIIARNRYRIFGRSDTCLLPEAKYRDRFLDSVTSSPQSRGSGRAMTRAASREVADHASIPQ